MQRITRRTRSCMTINFHSRGMQAVDVIGDTEFAQMRYRIIKRVIVPHTENEAIELSKWTVACNSIGNYLSIGAKFCTGASSVLAFSAGFYNNSSLAYLAGLSGTLALMLGQFSSYAKRESRSRITLLNNLLSYLGISHKMLVDDVQSVGPGDQSPENDAASSHYNLMSLRQPQVVQQRMPSMMKIGAVNTPSTIDDSKEADTVLRDYRHTTTLSNDVLDV